MDAVDNFGCLKRDPCEYSWPLNLWFWVLNSCLLYTLLSVLMCKSCDSKGLGNVNLHLPLSCWYPTGGCVGCSSKSYKGRGNWNQRTQSHMHKYSQVPCSNCVAESTFSTLYSFAGPWLLEKTGQTTVRCSWLTSLCELSIKEHSWWKWEIYLHGWQNKNKEPTEPPTPKAIIRNTYPHTKDISSDESNSV